MGNLAQNGLVRFGVFEVDLRTEALRKNGHKLKLGGQPFQVLGILLEHPGEVITREELQKRIWPDTFVDFEHNLNSSINRIREVLGDSAENPRYIETVPRKGYRFVAPVNGAAALTSSTPVLQPPAELRMKISGRRDRLTTLRVWGYLALGLVLLGLITAVLEWRNSGKNPQITRYSQITADGQGKSSGYASEAPAPLVGDGARLYFVEGPVGAKRLVQVSAQGGETSFLPISFGIRRVLDVSPRHELLVSAAGDRLESETPLMILPLPGGPPYRVGNILGHDGSWARDGKQIVYAEGHSLFLTDSSGKGARKLADVAGTAWWPRWSPDGTRIRFTVLAELGSQSPAQEIWEVLADGSHLQRAFVDVGAPPVQCCGNWTGDGKYYVFSSPDSFSVSSSGQIRRWETFATQLWAFREQADIISSSKKLFRLTAGPMSMASPLPTPESKKLFALAQHQRGQLVRFDREVRQFVPFLQGISATDVDISRDRQWVVYVSYPEGTLWRSRLDGSDQLQLTLPPMQVILPRWSPDGTQIAFVGDDHIYLVPRDGGTPEPAGGGTPLEGEPTWSQDGKSLAFAPWFWLDGKSGISLLDLKTGSLKPLSGFEGLFSPRYSPDGKYIAALTVENSTLVLVDVKSGTKQKLCEGVAYPNWSRDGRYINFDKPYQEDTVKGDTGLYRVRISDGKIEKVVTLEPRLLSWAIVGKWNGLAADDSPLVLRDTSVDEIYALDWDTR
ncbi:MAG TPA: winged helix-turn-helix domain-containing protein [Terriglobales bacterium]|nr:winged helix-turn-helix domain-containing protein [Terriglobales bacterium]